MRLAALSLRLIIYGLALLTLRTLLNRAVYALLSARRPLSGGALLMLAKKTAAVGRRCAGTENLIKTLLLRSGFSAA